MKKIPSSPTNAGWEKSVVINDLQIPFHDKKAVDVVLRFMKWFKPDQVFLNGDILDLYRAGKYETRPDIGKSIKNEIEETNEFLHTLRKTVGDACKIIYIFGNHEYRLDAFILRNATELWGMKGISLKEQLDCKELNIKVVYSGLRESFYEYGKLWVGHFDMARAHSGFTAKGLVDKYGVSIIQGHTSRFGSHFRTLITGEVIGGWENAGLCITRDYHYATAPNWQVGFSTIWKERRGSRFHVEQQLILENKFFYGGVLWE